MKLDIVRVTNPGDLGNERLVLRARANLDVGAFAVFRAYVRDGRVTNLVRATYWFPDKPVNTDDIVVLYSKAGKQSEKTLTGGSKAHFFYWALSEPAWGSKETAPVIVFVSEWDTHFPKPEAQPSLFDEGQSSKPS